MWERKGQEEKQGTGRGKIRRLTLAVGGGNGRRSGCDKKRTKVRTSRSKGGSAGIWKARPSNLKPLVGHYGDQRGKDWGLAWPGGKEGRPE